jgi:flagellar assembly protein FliH
LRAKHQNPPAAPVPVLRGIVMHAHPHALARPGRATAPASKANTPVSPAAPAAAESAAAHASIEAAFTEGRQEGFAAGHAAALSEARLDLQAATEEARSIAAEEGRAAGLQQGLREAQAEAARAQLEARGEVEQAACDRMQRLDRLLDAAGAESTKWLAEIEDDLVALTHEVACRVLGEHAAQPVVLQAMVKHLLAQHGQRAQLAVHVHPEDYEALVREAHADASDAPWRWVADKTVQMGGVILRSPEGSLDARLETQLAALRDALHAHRRERKSGAPRGKSE